MSVPTDREPTPDEALRLCAIHRGWLSVNRLTVHPARYDVGEAMWVADVDLDADLRALRPDLAERSYALLNINAALAEMGRYGLLMGLERLAQLVVTPWPLGERTPAQVVRAYDRWSGPDPYRSADPDNLRPEVRCPPWSPSAMDPSVEVGPPVVSGWLVHSELRIRARFEGLGARRFKPDLALAWLRIDGVPPARFAKAVSRMWRAGPVRDRPHPRLRRLGVWDART